MCVCAHGGWQVFHSQLWGRLPCLLIAVMQVLTFRKLYDCDDAQICYVVRKAGICKINRNLSSEAYDETEWHWCNNMACIMAIADKWDDHPWMSRVVLHQSFTIGFDMTENLFMSYLWHSTIVVIPVDSAAQAMPWREWPRGLLATRVVQENAYSMVEYKCG